MPVPDADALAHSQRCAEMLREEIRSAGGWLNFARFMERALYAPGLGYYAAGARKFGAAGDFVTAPEISPLFAECLARELAPVVLATQGEVLELGPGSGRLAFDLLTALDAEGACPRRYLLLEVSADLIERQKALLAGLPPHLRERVQWIAHLPEKFEGAIVANEVLDVVPVHLLHFTEGAVFERGVALEGERLVWRDAPLPASLWPSAEAIEACFPDGVPSGYLTEAAPGVSALVASLGESLARGALVFIDYGFHRAEYYLESRRAGTLMCYYRHTAHPDPFLYPGLQDLTTHVDFTRVAEAGAGAGLTLAGYTTQAQFLLEAGIAECLAARTGAGDALALNTQVQRLLNPAQMGESFKVIGFVREDARGEVTLPALTRARQRPL